MRARAGLALLLALAAAAVHSGGLAGGFIGFDDPNFVTENPYVRAGLTPASIRWAFTAHLTFDAWPYLDYWQPLTVLSRMLDVELFGLNPLGHKAMNLALHAANTALLFLVLERMTGAFWRSAFVAALFGVHPLRVESVAWVSERKDVLAGLFWLLTLAAYHAWVRRPGAGRYALVLLAFGLGLMAKPVLITLPFVLLLLDYWPLRRVGPEPAAALPRLLEEKLPLLVLAVASAAAGIWAQARAQLLISFAAEPFLSRLTAGCVDYVRYATRLVWPAPLALPHPYSPVWPGAVRVAATAMVLLATAGAILAARRRPYLAVGWLWFLAALVPVIGIVQPGKIPLTDRYTYLAHIGLIVAATWSVPAPVRLRVPRGLVPAAAAAILLACAAASVAQAGYWKDSVTLFAHAVAVTDHNYVAEYNLAHALEAQGRTAEALVHYEIGRSMRPAPAENTLGSRLAQQGRIDEAMARFREAVRLEPRYPDPHNNLGVLLARQGKTAEARREYEAALHYRPRYADALANLGRLEAAEGRSAEALAHLAAALEANPDLDGAYYSRANILAAAGRFAEAEADYRAALRLRPANADAHNNLGRVLALQGRAGEALAEYDAALRESPDHALARANRAELAAAQPGIVPAERR
jgi:tetratricopeptide (TPR) repeat protein